MQLNLQKYIPWLCLKEFEGNHPSLYYLGHSYILLITCEYPVGEYLALLPQLWPQHHTINSLTIAKRNKKSVSQGTAHFHSIQKSFCEKLAALNTATRFTAPPYRIKFSATISAPLLEAPTFKLSRDMSGCCNTFRLHPTVAAGSEDPLFWSSAVVISSSAFALGRDQ